MFCHKYFMFDFRDYSQILIVYVNRLIMESIVECDKITPFDDYKLHINAFLSD